ncbi:hypothetical protein L6164_007746 [Bauhinia variegata]|uniref:Uncharacterized protein n=1 Tax=Bauhinia variegata TaxID=167791 RepID=A0ACB9PEU9_BAUVA|nr:hypothetical protein L6164_007746 [Bauhinia variegata]
MMDYLPQEILECILHKLSLKTLVLCSSVCKEWKSLITDPSFISDHIGHTTKANSGNQHLLLRLWRFDWIMRDLICSQKLNIHLMIIASPNILSWLELAMDWLALARHHWIGCSSFMGPLQP